MPLTNQPYLPLYVDDWMNNTKIKQSSMAAHGLMISIMCLMHKEEPYGKLLLNQMYNQTQDQVKNFASFLVRVTSYDLIDIEKHLGELLYLKILLLEENTLICPRMVRDGEISVMRSKIGGKGGKKTQKNIKKNFAKAKQLPNGKATVLPNTGTENGTENENVIEVIIPSNS